MTSSRPIDSPIEKSSFDEEGEVKLLDVITILAARWRILLAVPLIAGVAAFGIASIIPPTFTAQTIFLPPQPQQNTAASALASLGALSGLAGGVAGIKTPGDQYIALMQSVNIQDRIVDRFKLMDLYESKYRFEARRVLEKNVRMNLGKKDGLISIEVDAPGQKLAADIANQYVTELRRLTSELALTDAQQRRAFFESELKNTRAKLADAQQALQSGGFDAGAIKAEPKAAAENYAQLKAQLTAAEVRLQTLRRTLTETATEVQQQASLVGALQGQLVKLEVKGGDSSKADYVGRYREYKYQEALFELFSKQYEIARMDESRDGGLIQVIDVAMPPEQKSKPRRSLIAAVATALTGLLLAAGVLIRHGFRNTRIA